MSRYPLQPNPSLLQRIPHAEVVVGWDTALQTFFAEVLDPDRPATDNEIVEAVGMLPYEVATVETLARWVQAYAVLPDDLRARLTEDQATAPAPTPLQQHMLKVLARVAQIP
jgi:hypothetical protein